jgi:hypothetical protein
MREAFILLNMLRITDLSTYYFLKWKLKNRQAFSYFIVEMDSFQGSFYADMANE